MAGSQRIQRGRCGRGHGRLQRRLPLPKRGHGAVSTLFQIRRIGHTARSARLEIAGVQSAPAGQQAPGGPHHLHEFGPTDICRQPRRIPLRIESKFLIRCERCRPAHLKQDALLELRQP